MSLEEQKFLNEYAEFQNKIFDNEIKIIDKEYEIMRKFFEIVELMEFDVDFNGLLLAVKKKSYEATDDFLKER